MNPDIVTDCDCYLGRIVPLEVRVPTEADIFGLQSRLVSEAGPLPQPVAQDSWVENYTYEGLVVAIFILLCYLIYNFRGDILQLFRFLVMRTSSDKIFSEQNQFFKRFVNLTTLLGVLLAGTLIVRLAGYFGIDRLLPEPVRSVNANLIPLAALLIPGIVIFYRWLVTKLVAAITQNQTFFTGYRFMSHLSGAVSFLILIPFFLLFALGESTRPTFFIWLTISIASLLYLVYLAKSCSFFIERNVSILQWILYLCAVELFPVSFLLLSALRFG